MGETEARRQERDGVTWRAVALALFLLALISVAGYYGELVYGASYMFASGVPSMASVFLLLVLAALNSLAPRLGRQGLSRRELLVIYATLLVGGPLMTHGILAWMIGHDLAPRYFARAITEWQGAFLQHFPEWFSPSDPTVVENYFIGETRVPWAAWWPSVLAWGSFLTALFVCTLCVVVIFRQQWVTHERLSFPLAQVPLEAVQEETTAGGRRARLSGATVFWIGFGITLAIAVVNALGIFFPAMPGIPLYGKTLMQWQKVGPLAGLGQVDLYLDPTMIAIAFLIPKELSFSCWLFWFVRVALTVLAISAGHTPQLPEDWYETGFPAPYYQGGGAVIALGLWVVWIGRRHLSRVLRLAVTGKPDTSDVGEPIAYRWAFLGALLCFAYMVYFCLAIGARFTVGLAMVALIVALYVMWARLRADTGLGFIPFPLGVEDMLLVPGGSAALRPREAVALIGLRWAYFPGFGESSEVVTGNCLEAFKIADAARLPGRPLLRLMVAGFLFSLVVGIYVLLTGMYHYGFYNINAASSGWLHSQMRGVGGRICEMVTNPSKFDVNGLLAMASGAVVAVGLGLLRLRLWWWPLHPFGYLAANCWGMHWYWMSFFAGWVLKSLAVRYGGLQLYRRMVPLSIGLLIGDQVGSGLRVVLTIIARSS
jgi:hypothetical protein